VYRQPDSEGTLKAHLSSQLLWLRCCIYPHRCLFIALLRRMATSLHAEVLVANGAYVTSFGDKKSLALPPARAAAFLVCESV
jgi:hypothetical protein